MKKVILLVIILSAFLNADFRELSHFEKGDIVFYLDVKTQKYSDIVQTKIVRLIKDMKHSIGVNHIYIRYSDKLIREYSNGGEDCFIHLYKPWTAVKNNRNYEFDIYQNIVEDRAKGYKKIFLIQGFYGGKAAIKGLKREGFTLVPTNVDGAELKPIR